MLFVWQAQTVELSNQTNQVKLVLVLVSPCTKTLASLLISEPFLYARSLLSWQCPLFFPSIVPPKSTTIMGDEMLLTMLQIDIQ